jgi:hypothetical protein
VNNGGANYVDVGHTRYLSLDFSLYMEGGEASFKKSEVGVMRAQSSEKSVYFVVVVVVVVVAFWFLRYDMI